MDEVPLRALRKLLERVGVGPWQRKKADWSSGPVTRGALLWVEPALDVPSGGLRYNQQVREALRRRGTDSRVLSVRGSWPCPSREAVEDCIRQVRRHVMVPDVQAVIVDGLIGGCVPELLELPSMPNGGSPELAGGADSSRQGALRADMETTELSAAVFQPTVSALLVHLSLVGAQEAEDAAQSEGITGDAAGHDALAGRGADSGDGQARPVHAGDGACVMAVRERRAVEAARVVLTTSCWSAADLRRRYDREDILVAAPGVARTQAGGRPEHEVQADIREGPATPEECYSMGRPLRLTCVASLNPLKDQQFLADVLEPLQDVEWTLTLAGPGADTPYGRGVLAELRHRLPGRVQHCGVLGPEDLAGHWASTDLLLLPSRLETYGMVVTEACAHGVPSFVSAGTGAEEALGDASVSSGRALPQGSHQEWTDAIRDFLTMPRTRAALADGVRSRRRRLPTWDEAAEAISVAVAAR